MSVCDCCPSSMCTDRATAKLEAELAEAKAELADWQHEFDLLLTQFSASADAAQLIGDKVTRDWAWYMMHELKQAARHLGYKKLKRKNG